MTESITQPLPSNLLIKDFKREAKKLHKQAVSDNKLTSLPILRRLIKQNVYYDVNVMELLKKRAEIQLKHTYQLLAKEVGYNTWADLKLQLNGMSDDEKLHYSMKLKGVGYPNLWFSNVNEAADYAQLNGGEVISVGDQAVVVPD